MSSPTLLLARGRALLPLCALLLAVGPLRAVEASAVQAAPAAAPSIEPALPRTAAPQQPLVTAPPATPHLADRTFETSPTLRTEAHSLIDLLEEVSYNRDAVHPANYSEVIGDFMGELDGQRLFFLASDKAAFDARFDKNLYWNVKNLGDIKAAYEIFSVYLARTEARANWIAAELKKNIDLSTNEFYTVDRSKAEWPADAAAADDLWRKRLKFEVLAEVLNGSSDIKPAESHKKSVVPAAADQQPAGTAVAAADGQATSSVATTDQKPVTPKVKAPPTPEELDQLVQAAKETVRKRYERMVKNVGEIENYEIAEMFLTTITELYDPHSAYLSAESFEDFGIQMKLKLVGIGALLESKDDYCVVKEIIPGGPADLSKQLHPDDKIIAVAQAGGEPVEIIGMKLRKIVDMIRGNKDTQVHLIVQPADAADPSVRKNIVLTRDLVKIESSHAHAAIFEVPDASGKISPVGVITLPAFYGDSEDDTEPTSASKDVAMLLTRLKAAGVKGIVLDLRHNCGGLLSEAIELTGLFVGKGPVVQVRDYQNRITVDSDDEKIAYTGPLAVLVDRYSASASEIAAGALQNYGRAIVIGDSSTHGKGTVQQIIEMREYVAQLASSPVKTGATKLTIQKFYLPNGSSTQLKGVVPDIILPSIDDYIPQLGESELPHALVWDEIPSSSFDGQPLDASVLGPLRAASRRRQDDLEEFTYLRKNIDWFKEKEAQKLVSLNLDQREKQKSEDDAFRKTIKAEHDRLAKNDFPYTEIRLGPPPPPKIKTTKKSDDDSDDDLLGTDDDGDSYAKVDIDLREALRVINDAVDLGKAPEFAASGHAPLTAPASKKG